MLRSSLAIMTIALTLVACPKPEDKETSDDGAGDETTGGHPSSGSETGATPAAPPPERPEEMPLLCSIDNGKWCSGCPQYSAGPLCCADGTCIPWDVEGPACDGALGWCNNYSTDPNASKQNIKLAICHDE